MARRKTLSRTTIADRTYDALLEAICSGALPVGARLNQDEIAARLNVSRQPVNRAIAMLKAQHFLEDTGKRGVVVAALDPLLFRSIYELRTVIEPLSAQLAAAAITPAAMARGRSLIAQGKALTDGEDHAAALRADMAFHDLLYTLAGNVLIAEAMRLNWRHLHRAMSEALSRPGATGRIWIEHEAIFEAICRGDADAAARHMSTHMRDSFFRALPGNPPLA
ncbi:putative HTH-type transcriptional regulator YdfH [Roseovarius sp. A-2]|uniref:GntR family transcriptional regulator n=1 Tax=Roseovarius sp. A-2 TaxID=1570360 RepID=UPI0009B58461|nr:GntR family transcriptional regulator [Roseovarius sp. A-2]GAW37020.1 putative HTH-type transcriptional regulator YdfH [Roseovarius sp. A-2]